MGLMRATKSGETRNLKCGESRATSQSHRRIDNKIGRRRDPERQTARVDGNAISLGARPTGHNASKTVAAKLSQRPPSARPVAPPSEQLRSESLPRRQPKPPAA